MSRIVRLDQEQPTVAADIHALLQAAWRVEARLLGIEDFAPLRRTARQIRASSTLWFGLSRADRLEAVAEINRTGTCPHIDSLAVHPRSFRQGLAKALLENLIAAWAPLTVGTAQANTPALDLYRQLGFTETSTFRTPDGVAMVTLRRTCNGD